MTQSHLAADDDQIMDTMVDLTRLSKSHRVIVAGSQAFDIYLGLYQRGFCCVATTATCRIPCGQHDVALIVGRHSIQTLETLLFRIVTFLNTRSTLAVWVSSDERQCGRTLPRLLERLGFRIEAAAKCNHGVVLSARRSEWSQLAKAA